MAYASETELRQFVGAADAQEDGIDYLMVVKAASQAIDTACGVPAGTFGDAEANGNDSIVPVVRLATLLQASRWVKRKDAPFGIAGAMDGSQPLRLLSRLDPDVEALLDALDYTDRDGTTTNRPRYGVAF